MLEVRLGDLSSPVKGSVPRKISRTISGFTIAQHYRMRYSLDIDRAVNEPPKNRREVNDMYERKRRLFSATSIPILPDEFRMILKMRNIQISEVGPMVERSDGWMHAILSKRRINFYMLDKVAIELGMSLDELLEKVLDAEDWYRL